MDKKEYLELEVYLKADKHQMSKILGKSTRTIEYYRTGGRVMCQTTRNLVSLIKLNKNNLKYLLDTPN